MEELIIVLSFFAGILACAVSVELLGKTGRNIPSFIPVAAISGIAWLGLLLFGERSYWPYFLSFIFGVVLYVPFWMILGIFLVWKDPAKYKERSMKEKRRLKREAESLKDTND